MFLSKARNQNRKLWEQVLPMLQGGQFKDVQSMTARSDAAVGKIVNYGLTRMQSPGRREDFDAAMEEGMMEIVPRLESAPTTSRPSRTSSRWSACSAPSSA